MESSTPVFPPGQWFAESPLLGFRQGYAVRRELHRGQSPYQSIAVVETGLLGTTLILENAVQTSSVDEHIYHEMLVHPALATLRRPRNVLIIGGGDGGALRRVLEYRSVRRAVQVELDREVVEVSLRFLPEISAGAYDDRRAELIIGDGALFLAQTDEKFDTILVDSTDPIGPAEVLFGDAFYRAAYRALTDDGILVTQSGSPLLMGPELARAARRLKNRFPVVRPYLANIPSYPGVIWSFLAASKADDPAETSTPAIRRRMAGIATKYYTPEIHRAAFALPAELARSLESAPEEEVGLLPGRAAFSR